MIEDVVIEEMTNDFVLWRCLHGGPLTHQTIDQWPLEEETKWKRYRRRNLPLLMKITSIYGACAIVARDNEAIVGYLRFYPKVICGLEGAGGLCLMQDFPAGPAENFAGSDFPTLEQIKDKTLAVHCLMTGSPLQKDNPYQRKGLGTRLVKALIPWAKKNGWEKIEADSFEDIPIIYEMTGSAGHTFWEKLGFCVVDRHPHPELQDRNSFPEFVAALEKQAKDIGILPERARDRIVMRLDLT
ncbi:MAG: GNAT family N-acetyltransferase [Candidatus Aminicenantes bacterium]|nr:GNAT family N-acetyltransferase [Candidatus Aminicenantes bacterium]